MVTVLTRLGLTVVAVVLFGLGLRMAPFMDRGAPPEPTPPTRGLETGLGSGAPVGSALTLNGFPLEITRSPVEGGCDGEPLDPRALGLCSGEDCRPLAQGREDGASTVAWRDETAGHLRTAMVTCGPNGHGELVELVLADSLVSGNPDDLEPEPPGHRLQPIPSLPETEPVADLESGGFRVFLDRSVEPRLDLERLQLALVARGWVTVPGTTEAPPGLDSPAPPARVLLRGEELALLTVQIDASSSYLISAYSRPGWTEESP